MYLYKRLEFSNKIIVQQELFPAHVEIGIGNNHSTWWPQFATMTFKLFGTKVQHLHYVPTVISFPKIRYYWGLF